jgi:hypothetical protein
VRYVFVRCIDDDSSDSDSNSDKVNVKSFISFRYSAAKWGNVFMIYCNSKFHPLNLATSRGAIIITGS